MIAWKASKRWCLSVPDVATAYAFAKHLSCTSLRSSSSFSSWQYSRLTSLPQASDSSSWAWHCTLIASCATLIASSMSDSCTSDISPSTIMMLSIVAATIISMSALSNSENVGLIINFPSTRATRTSEIGPLKGISETARAAEAAKPANASGISSPSAENNITFTYTSAW